MFPVLLLAACPPSPGLPVELSDALAFGIDGPTARAMWRLTQTHPTAMRNEVAAWNSPRALCEWEMECEWRRNCWDKLDDVLFHPCAMRTKVNSLRRLRELLGDEDYYGGRMPSPIPAYRR